MLSLALIVMRQCSTATLLGMLTKKIKKHRHYDPGDLLIVCDIAGMSNMIEEAKAVYVVDKSSVVSKPSIIENLWYTNTEDTWIRVWDGEGANV